MSNKLDDLESIKNKICLLHYACSDFSIDPIKISTITIFEYTLKKAHTFSIIDSTEKEMLVKFFEYIKNYPEWVFVGWNLKSITYGVQVIERRYKQLLNEEIPFEIKPVFDLDSIIQEKYGTSVSHGMYGKMQKLFEMNSINLTYFLDGKTEAELYDKNEIRKVEMSNDSKVQGMKKILDLLFEDNLKVEVESGKINKIYHKIELDRFRKLINEKHIYPPSKRALIELNEEFFSRNYKGISNKQMEKVKIDFEMRFLMNIVTKSMKSDRTEIDNLFNQMKTSLDIILDISVDESKIEKPTIEGRIRGSAMLQPNLYGVGIDLKKLFRKK